MAGVPLEKGPSPIKVTVLEALLSNYPCREDANYLLEDFKYGCRIPAVGECSAFFAQNLKSVYRMVGVVQDKIAKEVKEGRVLGPFINGSFGDLEGLTMEYSVKKGPGRVQINAPLVLVRGSIGQ